MDPIKDADGNELKLPDLVRAASQEIIRERAMEASNLIKNFLVKSEQVAEQLKTKRMEVTKLEVALNDTLEKLKKLRAGDWSVLKDNQGRTKPDSSQKPAQGGE